MLAVKKLKAIMRNYSKKTSTNLQQMSWEHLKILLREIIQPNHVPVFLCECEPEIEEAASN